MGLVPKGTQVGNLGISLFEYGEYLLVCALARDDFERLKECFNADESFLLFPLACIFVFEGYIGLKPSESIYERVILFRNMSEREKLTKEYIKKMEEGSRSHTMEGLQRNMKTFGLIVLETNLGIDAQDVYRYYKARWSIETYYDRIKHSMDFCELNLSEYGMVQAVAFVMLLSGRIDQSILSTAKSVGKQQRPCQAYEYTETI